MSNRMQEILSGILGMFGNDQNPRVIDKSQYMTAGQEYLYGDKQGTPINMTGVTTTPNFAQMSNNKGIMTDPQMQRMSTGVTTTPMSTEPYSRNFPKGYVFDERKGLSYGSMNEVQNTKPTLTSDMIDTYSVKGQEGQMSFDDSEEGLLGKIERGVSNFGDYLTSQRGLSNLAIAFQGMTLNPNQAIIDLNQKRLDRLDRMEGANRTSEQIMSMMKEETDPEKKKMLQLIIDSAKTGEISGNDMLKQAVAIYKGGGINLNLGDNKALYDAVGKDLVDRKKDYREKASASSDVLGTYRRVTDILNRMGSEGQGLTAAFRQELRQQVGGIPLLAGFVDTTQFSTARELQAAINGLVAIELRKNKGPQTDFDALFQERILPNIQNPAEANAQLIKYGNSSNYFNIALNDIVKQASYSKPEEAIKILDYADSIKNQVPTVFVDEQSGQVQDHFSDYYMSEEMRQFTPLERIESWANLHRRMYNPAGTKYSLEDLLKTK